ncbi:MULTISPECIES: hypothetical protein [unclassified Micromonospora]|uniref:hypothetical protein n=1 Tax=unclassified Micromonospora TaxID=2617518 RepID=UPI001052580E|nr:MULTISPECIES: hypothetical protein [unclassified Micromonospora]TDB78623.1 hypothetical protein E1182_15525 [Micromonospora sp. KC721]TDC32440.1 hypothetical protein E1166_26785 [Micromonospora sp. KC213]
MRQEEQQANQEHPEAVRSAPVPVPPTADATAHRDRNGLRPYQGRERDGDDDGDRPEFHDPAPLPTVFGAATVGDAVAASALASGRPEDERDARQEDTALPGDGAPGRTDPFDDERADPTAADRIHDRDRWEATHPDVVTATAAGPDGVRRDGDAPAAGYGSAVPTMVDPDAGTTAADPVTAAAGATGANVPTHAATLFEADAAQAFRDRWREVQLRFVDDPRAAVGEAQALVEEAIEALSAALSAQKQRIGDWRDAGSADTEQLRVAVRQYRDFLDRVLGR